MSGHPYQCTASYGASRLDERLRIKANLTARSVLVHLPGGVRVLLLGAVASVAVLLLGRVLPQRAQAASPSDLFLSESVVLQHIDEHGLSMWHSIDAHADAIRAIHTQLGEFLSEPT